MTKIEDGALCLVGAGKMGSALLAGWIKAGEAKKTPIVVIDPNINPEIESLAKSGIVLVNPELDDLEEVRFEVCVLAVKPQVMDEAMKSVQFLRGKGTAILSIAAGRTIGSFESYFGSEVPIVRTMPNTPASIGRGISVACANSSVSPEVQARVTDLLQSVGQVAWIDDEEALDAVTGVSGSGPAYVFLLIECLALAGARQGLDADLSMQLARATVEGAGALAALSDETPNQLRKNVTSPKGTTEAALKVLMGDGGLEELMAKAVAAATARSKELG
jgi:pyrroline-5-carboxylate reductase